MLGRGINARILSGSAFRIEDLAIATWSTAVSSVTALTSLPSETFCDVRYAQLPSDDSFIRAYATARVDGVSSPTAIPFCRWTSQTTMHGSDTSPQGATECWKCASILDTSHDAFFCPNCGAIQAVPKGSTTFSLLGLNPTFEIDLDNLEATFKGLQRRLHPDRFTTSSSKERELSAEASAMVNKAYDILRHPLKRAKCLLEHHGIHSDEGRTIRDPSLLEFVMDAREQVETSDDKEELLRLKTRVEEHMQRCMEEIKKAFRSHDVEKAVEAVTVLTYMNRIEEAIVDKI